MMVQFRMFGFPVTITGTVLVIAGMYVLFDLQAEVPLLLAIVGAFVVFGSILFHELGHALAARGFRLGSVQITLHGFGGHTTYDRRADRPWKDLLVILAGPTFGFILAGLSLPLMLLPAGTVGRSIAGDLLFINVFWSMFNLLPLFPMDGGQALAATLRMFVPGLAVPITFWVGIVGGGALGLGALALSYSGFGTSIFLLLIAGMIVQQNLQLRRSWLEAGGRRPGLG